MMKALTEGRDEVAPELGGLPGEEEESEEADDDAVHRLVGEFGVDAGDLGEVGGFGGPHGRGAETQQYAGGHEGVEARVELRGDVRGVAEQGETQRPLDSEPFDEERGHEDAGDDERRVDGGQGDRAETLLGVDGALQVGRPLERGELHHER